MDVRAALIFFVALPALAEQGILVVHAAHPSDRPLANVRIGTKGDGGEALTDASGKARIRLAPQTRAGVRVTLTILKAPRDLVFISPWDHQASVPPFENESQNYVPVVLAERGDRAMLESGRAIQAVTASILKSIAPEPLERRRKSPLKSVGARLSRRWRGSSDLRRTTSIRPYALGVKRVTTPTKKASPRSMRRIIRLRHRN